MTNVTRDPEETRVPAVATESCPDGVYVSFRRSLERSRLLEELITTFSLGAQTSG